MRVIVIEDDEVYGPALVRALAREGHDAVLFSGVSALDAAEPDGDVAVVDLHLPDGSGLDAVRLLVGQGIPSVMLSGHGSVRSAVQGMRAGAVDFLSKPVSTGELVAALGDAVGTRPAPSPASERLEDVEREHIQRVLDDCDGNISEAARRLGLYRRTLQRKLQKM